MFLRKAEGFYFRNYKHFSLEFNTLINIFTGDNGQGKSSLLEALYCGLRGKSFQPFINSHHLVKNNKKQASLSLTLEEEEGISSIKAEFFQQDSLKKRLFYCGKKTSPSFLLKKIPCFVFTEASMKCIRQGPDQRRAFVDEMLCHDHQKTVKDNFYKVLQQKRQLLDQIKKRLLPYKEAKSLLLALNQQFIKSSVLLTKERLKLLRELFSSLQKEKAEIFKEPKPYLDFSYKISEELEKEESLSLFLEKEARQKIQQEMQQGRPLYGPQKHEIDFLFNGENSRTFCSKGEQRAFILSLMASLIQKSPGALLFLDDALLELDEPTQCKFLQFLEKSRCQSFLTSCKVISFRTKKTSLFSVKNGTVNKA